MLYKEGICNIYVCIYNKILVGILTFDFTRDLVGLCPRQVFNSNNKKILNGT